MRVDAGREPLETGADSPQRLLLKSSQPDVLKPHLFFVRRAHPPTHPSASGDGEIFLFTCRPIFWFAVGSQGREGK